MSLEPPYQNLKFKKLMYYKKVCVFQYAYSCDLRIQLCLNNPCDPCYFKNGVSWNANTRKNAKSEKVEWIARHPNSFRHIPLKKDSQRTTNPL